MRKFLGALLWTLLAVTAANANVILDRTSFDASYPGLPSLDFEGIAPTAAFIQDPDLSAEGLAFDAGPGNTSFVVLADSAFLGTPSDILGQAASNSPLRIEFLDPVEVVGFDLGLFPIADNVTIEIFNGAQLLDSTVVAASDFTTFQSFAGFSELGPITSLIVTPPVNQVDPYLTFIDNLAYGVPEPTTGALMAAGAMLLLRRRQF